MTPVLQNALRLHRSGAVGEAEKIYLEVLAKDAADPIALHYLGLVRLRQSRLEEALELMRRSVAIAPSQADFHLNLGIALLDAGVLSRTPAGEVEFPFDAVKVEFFLQAA